VAYELADGTTVLWDVKSGRRGASSADVWDTAVWDTASWDGGTNIDFKVIPESLIHSFSINSGKDKFGRRFKASTLTLRVDNTGGVFTPQDSLLQPGDYVALSVLIETPAGPPDALIPDGFTWPDGFGNTWTNHGGKTLMDDNPGVPVLYPMWYGRVDEATDTVRNGVDITKVICYDVFGELAAVDKDAQAGAGAGEVATTRVTRIGDNASTAFGGVLFSTAPFIETMQATTLAKNALEEMHLTMESEGGDMWADREVGTVASKGKLQLRGRDWLTTDTRSTVVQWFLNGAMNIPIIDAQITREQQLLVNNATVSMSGGVSQNAQDAVSIQRYGDRTTRRLDLVGENDTQAQFLATRFVANLKDIRPRVRQVTVDVIDAKSALFGSQVEHGDLVQVTVQSIHGWSFTAQAHVIGIRFEVVDQTWVIVLRLSDAFIDNVDGAYSSAYSNAFRLG